MIQIHKPTALPTTLSVKGHSATTQLCQDYDDGIRVFEFDKKIFGASDVKDTLKTIQHNKCCYCERKTEIGDVEHYRPKASYYWLVYDWSNLFFSCDVCNRYKKRDLFPLKNIQKRAKSHQDNIHNEEPLLINPAETDPQGHITFKAEIPVGKTDEGRETISVLGLDREFLIEQRISLLKQLKLLFNSLNEPTLPTNLHNEIRQFLQLRKSNDAEYSATVRDAIATDFRYIIG